MLRVQSWTPDDGRKDRPKHVEWYSVYSKIVHLVGITVEIYHNALSHERQMMMMMMMVMVWMSVTAFLCNKNQLDALFILSFFRQWTSTCFGHICSPSSGGILYIYIYTHTHTHTHNNRYVLYIYSIPPDDRLQICRKHVEVDWRKYWG